MGSSLFKFWYFGAAQQNPLLKFRHQRTSKPYIISLPVVFNFDKT